MSEGEFLAAQQYVRSSSIDVDDTVKLRLYGLYKQATEGDCTASKPGLFSFAARAKWDAWKALSGMSSEAAKQGYVEALQEIAPSFLEQGAGSSTSGGGGDAQKKQSKSAMGPTQSLPSRPECSDDIWSWVSDGDAKRIAAWGDDVNVVNEDGSSLLHIAADRGHVEVVRLLLSKGANVNAQDEDGATPLHLSAMCANVEVVKLLRSAGADVSVTDVDGATALDFADDDDTKAALQ